HTPGLGLDAKGVALGAKGMVLLPSIDRLVALLAMYTRERSLEDIVPSLGIVVVRSPVGTREVALEFAAESSDRMDRIADTARLVGGVTFTGTSRHFVQYRDAPAPLRYHAPELASTDAPLALYHDRFAQTYELERRIELKALLLRLMPRSEPATRLEAGIRYIVAEPGVGPSLAHYFIRSRVEGDACIAEWPPPSAFVESPLRRWLIRIPELPERMRRLVHETPGITCFVPAGPVLLRGRGEEPWAIDRLPPMGALSSLSRVELRTAGHEASHAAGTSEPPALHVKLRVVPSGAPLRNVTASWIWRAQLPLLRRLAYALPHATIAQVRIAVTGHGAFLK